MSTYLVEVNPEDIPETEQEFEMEYNMVIEGSSYDYNKSVSIELPAEAEEAVEMPQMK